MDEIDGCLSNLGAYAAVRQRLEEMVIAQQKACEELQQSVFSRLLLSMLILQDFIDYDGKTDGNHLTMFYVFYPHNIYIIQFVSVRGIH